MTNKEMIAEYKQIESDVRALLKRYRTFYDWDDSPHVPEIQVLAQLVFDLVSQTEIGGEYDFIKVYRSTEETADEVDQDRAQLN